MGSSSYSADVLEKGHVEATSPQEAVRSSATFEVAAHPSTIANPGTLGLFAFASTTLMLSLYNVQARGISTPNVVLGMAIFCGGLAQFLAGMWEFPRGNTFGGTAFTSYGAFWLAYSCLHLPFTGIRAAYTDAEEFSNAVAIFLFSWFLVTLFLLVAALRKSIAFIALLGFLATTFLVLSIADFTRVAGITKAGGILGVITAAIAFYVGLSELLAAEDMAIIQLPLGVFPKRI